MVGICKRGRDDLERGRDDLVDDMNDGYNPYVEFRRIDLCRSKQTYRDQKCHATNISKHIS